MKKNIFLFPIVIITIFTVLTGCSSLKRETKEDTKQIETEDKLEDGQFYIYHKKNSSYEKVYVNDASYDLSEDPEISNTTTTSNDARTLRFTDDYEKIPTLYSDEGDQLIFYSTKALDDTFVLERFEAFGWTFGISGMTKMGSDRYSFMTDDDSNNIDKNSSAAILIRDFPSSKLVIDQIGGTDVRSKNVSRGGTIIGGLKRGKNYDVDLYAGTEHYRYSLTADTYAMTSMAAYEDTDFSFLGSKVLQVNLPSWFNSGYYDINSLGVFRYVKGDSYGDSTDFNIPNKDPDADYSEDIDLNGTEASSTMEESNNETQREYFTIDETQEVKVTVTYDNTGVSDDIAAVTPEARVTSGDFNYPLSASDSEDMLTLTYSLPAGDYTLEITNLYGRSYNYKVQSH